MNFEPDDPLVTIEEFLSVEELEVVRGMLESAGIECFSPDSQMSRLYAMGVRPRLQVRESQLEDARAILHSIQNAEDDSEKVD